MGHRILVVDDDSLVITRIEQVLLRAGYDVITAETSADATLALQDAASLSLLIADIKLESMVTGWDLARQARTESPNLPILYLTGQSEIKFASESVPDSALLEKPFSDSELIAATTHLLA